MFELSSAVDNADSLMSILLESGWTLAPEGHSKLFFQANHPDFISEIGDIISSKNNDWILNIVTRSSMEKYINLDTLRHDGVVVAPRQVGGTCYANACAFVLYLALRRIYKREGNHETFEKLRAEMIQEYGVNGAFTGKVLEKYSKKYRLRSKKVDENEAKIAMSHRRPIVATFHLAANQWEDFSKFYQSNPKGILKKSNLSASEIGEIGGHAVILMKVTPEYLLFMNSWGTNFADDGFFKVENNSVLNCQFFDVFWTLNDLTPGEKAAYEEIKKSGGFIFEQIPESVKSLPYTCPKCHQSSPAKQFKGHFYEAICPKCNQTFVPLLINFTFLN